MFLVTDTGLVTTVIEDTKIVTLRLRSPVLTSSEYKLIYRHAKLTNWLAANPGR
jgi:hypothetical protein